MEGLQFFLNTVQLGYFVLSNFRGEFFLPKLHLRIVRIFHQIANTVKVATSTIKKLLVTFLLTQPTRDIKISTLMKNIHCTALLVTY